MADSVILNATPNRLSLARAVANGLVDFDPDASLFVRYDWRGGPVVDRPTSTFNELRSAGLAKQIRFTRTELTEAGRLWLADNTKES
jgi:hypothetical protein